MTSRKTFSHSLFLAILCFLTFFLFGCDESSQNMKKADYSYTAKSEQYSFVINPDTLEISRNDGIWQNNPIVISGGNMEFCGIRQQLFADISVFNVAELLNKIFMGEIEKDGDLIKITGTYLRPFILSLNKKTLEPYSLYWLGENIIFE